MPDYTRNTNYLHPLLLNNLRAILGAIQNKLPESVTAKVISVHRSPADQFELYKQGRTFSNGSWVKTGDIVTNIDGFTKKSRHNYLPSTAIDIGLFESRKYLQDSPHYEKIRYGAALLGLSWGGDWVSLKDRPHIEIPNNRFFKSNIEKDSGLLWQSYLHRASNYTGAMDGIFGERSLAALRQATGGNERNLAAWDKLMSRFGILHYPISKETR